MNTYLKIFASLLFGLIIPTSLLFNVIISVSKLDILIGHTDSVKQVIENYKSVKDDLDSANDYALLSVLAAENANQKTMINKQVMKLAVIQIGFAVISIGLLFVVLGFNDGGLKLSGQGSELSFNVMTGSTGLAAIIIGASMSTLGGVLKNDYQTVEVPRYHAVGESPVIHDVSNALHQCENTFVSLPTIEKLEGSMKCLKAFISSYESN